MFLWIQRIATITEIGATEKFPILAIPLYQKTAKTVRT
jgi:hypothetical protein